MRRADLGLNTNAPGGEPDSYALVSRGAIVEDSSLLGFSGGTGTGVGLLVTGSGAQVTRSTLHTQGSEDGAGIVVEPGATGEVKITYSLIRGFVSTRGFIHNSPGNLVILFSELAQSGADGLVTDGTVDIGSTMRAGAIAESGGTAECAFNFTPAMVFIDC